MKYILLIILLCSVLSSNAQLQVQNIKLKDNFMPVISQIRASIFLPYTLSNAFLLNSKINFLEVSLVKTPNCYSYNDLAFFCKLEVIMEKQTQLPVKFRLGEFNEVERLEGKRYSDF